MSRLATVFMCAFVVLSAGGLARLTHYSVSYAYAKFGVYQKENENAALLNKLQFLGKFTKQQARKVEQLVVYEDIVRLKYGMNLIDDDVRKAGVGGKTDLERAMLASLMAPSVISADSIQESIRELLRQVALQNRTFARTVEYVKTQCELWSQRPSVWPARGRITSGFGIRIHPFEGYTLFHEGYDIANRTWTEVSSTADGIVSSVGWQQYYGNVVVIDHYRNGYQTRYAHLIQPSVVEGQVVKRGELVGYMGNSGRSTGPHLHYEVRKFDKPVNPRDYILPGDVVVD